MAAGLDLQPGSPVYVAAHEYIRDHHGNELSAEDAQHLRTGGIRGIDLVEDTARLAR